MKVKQLYVCELCHKEYNKKEEAETCEKMHRIPKEIASVRHISYKDNAKRFPILVTIIMTDGTKAVYRYDKEA